MSNHPKQLEAVEALYDQFGKCPFAVKDMSDELLDEVAALLEIRAPTRHSRKIKVGNCLSGKGKSGAEYDLTIGVRVRLDVLKPAEGRGGSAAVYQIQPVHSQS